ncbi:MAG: sensor histidine kinase [Rhodanobacteraceae bacterium]
MECQWRAAPDSVLGAETADARAHGSRALTWVWLIWLVWVFGPALFGQGTSFRHWLWPTLASLPVFIALYVVAQLCPRRRLVWFALAVTALALATLPFNAYTGTFVIYGCAMLADWGTPRRAFGLMLGLLVAFSIEWVILGIPWQYLANFWLLSLVIGGMGIYGNLQRHRRAELRLTHDEIRRLAASAERERIGRDLHDLLGHTLSLVALKSELAGRLIERDPHAARREIADVEHVAREALSQVRSAVSGIRAAALVSELASAHLLLETAGVHMVYRRDARELPADVETCLALALREAATNIERHARAGSVEVVLVHEGDTVRMRVRDDGRGGVDRHGNGLTGMRERVQALGGKLAIDSPRGHGTTIEVSLPMPPAARPASRNAPLAAPSGALASPAGGNA